MSITKKRNLEFKSVPKGLWGTIFFKIISTLVLSSLFIFFVSPFLGLQLAAFSGLAVCTYGIWSTILNGPWNWKNTVLVDYEKNQLQVISIKNQATNNVLDFTGSIYKVSEIEGFETEQFESFISSPVYLVKIKVRKKSIKLLAFEDASKFTDFVRILNKDFNIKIYGPSRPIRF